jgi:glutaconate CoA-transferase subunit A
MSDPAALMGVEKLAALIPNGSKIAVPPDYTGVAMELTRAMLRRGVRNLHLVCVPISGLQAELLIGAGAVDTLETSAVTLGEYGTAYRFVAGVREKKFRMLDATCPAVHAGIQAAGKGIPFMPLRGMLATDLLKHRQDWKVIDNPFNDGGDPIVLLPAIHPDISIFHAPYADRDGNIFVGRRRELLAMAHASKTTFVTVEEIRDVDLLDTEEGAAGTLPAAYVGGIAKAPRGAWPLNLWDIYDVDEAHIAQYSEMAQSQQGFDLYLDMYVRQRRRAAE